MLNLALTLGLALQPPASLTPTVGWVKSVERHTVNLTGVTSNTGALSKGQVAANCFPMSVMVAGANSRFWNTKSPKITYSGSNLTVARRVSAGNADYHVYTVEVHPLAARVQAIAFTLAADGGVSTSPAIPTPVAKAKAFATVTATNSSAAANLNTGNMRCVIASDGASVTITRQGSTPAAIDGVVYVVECLTDAFTVQHADSLDTAGSATTTATISSVATDKTFLVGSFEHEGTAAQPSHGGVYWTLTNGTTVTFGKSTVSGTQDGIGAVAAVTLKSNGGTVQRGSITYATGHAGSTDLGAAVTVANAVVNFNGRWGHPETADGTATDQEELQGALTLSDADTVAADSVTDLAQSRTYRFEVIDFALAA